jgi:RimJ/RimL family protein N-acetyltransferase
MYIYAQSERLYLREFIPTDAGLLFDLDSDPEVMRFLSDGKTTPIEQIQNDMPRILNYAQKHDHKLGIWVAHLNSSDEFIGWFLLRPDKKRPDDLKNIELGYRLKQKFWRQGFATEMSQVLLRKAFDLPATEAVFARTHLLNVGSWSVMKKLGMTFKHEYLEDDFIGADKRAVLYEITREQWANLQ